MDLSGNSEIDALVTQTQAGDVSSMLTLSQRYLDGNGLTRNDAEAFKWAKLAAENGSGKGYRLMQKAYEEGYGAEQCADKAIDCKINAEVIEGKLSTCLWHSFVRHSYEYSIFEYRIFAPVIYLANAARSLIYQNISSVFQR